MGDSDRAGLRRSYFSSALDSYAEFRVEDVLATTDIPADRAPLLGEQSTRVELRHDAPVEFTVSRRVGDVDEFDLDVRFGTGRPRPMGNVYGSSGEIACVKPNQVITDPCDNTCDAFLCKTFKALTKPLGGIHPSLLHMHCNRLLGAEQPTEQHVLGLLLRTREGLQRAPAH